MGNQSPIEVLGRNLRESMRARYRQADTRLVLVGAGASVEAGLPDGRRLHETFEQGVPLYKEIASNLREDRDVERVFRVIEQAGLLAGSRSEASDFLRGLGILYRSRRPQAERAISEARVIMSLRRKELWLVPSLAPMRGAKAPRPTDYLVPLIRAQESSSIVSLNYDNSLEIAAPSRVITTARGEKRVRVPEEDAAHTRVLKLHGSLDWKRVQDDVITGGLPRGALEYDPAIIFGAGNKLRYYGPFLSLFDHFTRRLEKSSVVVTIGYGYRDEHVNDALRVWAKDPDGACPDQRKLLVVAVGPRAEALPNTVQSWETLEHLDIEGLRGPASEVITHLFGDVKSVIDLD
jgi:SIR2-like domain